ncbi:MAG: Gluconate transporter [Oscillospiraceae bacterium]|jgi:gluconate:H+ symporter, GntP family
MSTALVLIVFTVCIVLMILLISKFKVHPAMSLLLSVFVLAIGIGTPWADISKTIQTGFGNTVKSVAIIIFLGCVLGKVLEESGAAVKITEFILKVVGKKKVIWAIIFSSAILGIPIFPESVVIMLIPIVSTLAIETGSSMMAFGGALYLGCLITSSLVPPTPGPIAAAALLNVPLGQAILWGIVVAIPGVIGAGFYCKTLKTPVLPKEEYLNAAKVAKEKDLPSVIKSFLPIILPLVLIVGNTVIGTMFPETIVANVFKFIGDPIAALFAGDLLSLTLIPKRWKTKTVLNDWVENALCSAAMPIIVTGLGGAFALFIKNAGIAEKIAQGIIDVHIPGILVPIIIAALIHVITGSNTLGVMTAAALVQPMLGILGISPLVAFLCCASGALMFKQANSSGFWVTTSMSNMSLPQGLRSVSGASTIAGICSSMTIIILNAINVI